MNPIKRIIHNIDPNTRIESITIIYDNNQQITHHLPPDASYKPTIITTTTQTQHTLK